MSIVTTTTLHAQTPLPLFNLLPI